MIQGSELLGTYHKEVITDEWIDKVISHLLTSYTPKGQPINHVISSNQISELINTASDIIISEGALVEVDAPIKVIGDIHGQFQDIFYEKYSVYIDAWKSAKMRTGSISHASYTGIVALPTPKDMQKLFDLIGKVPETKMIFLGDYVDRGPQSLETIIYLLALKVKYPDRIFLLRGNHETPTVNRIYGFYGECVLKYGAGIWWDFQSIFNRLPLAGLISKRVLCMHGGLSPYLTTLDQIRQVPLPCEPADKGMLIDLLWADPTNKGDGWFHSPRGISYSFGRGVVSAACKLLGIDLIIRAHQVVQDGYELMVGRMLITIFSAPNYAGQFNNAGAVVCIDKDLKVSFQQMRMENPALKCRPCPAVACAPGEALLLPSKGEPAKIPAAVIIAKTGVAKQTAPSSITPAASTTTKTAAAPPKASVSATAPPKASTPATAQLTSAVKSQGNKGNAATAATKEQEKAETKDKKVDDKGTTKAEAVTEKKESKLGDKQSPEDVKPGDKQSPQDVKPEAKSEEKGKTDDKTKPTSN